MFLLICRNRDGELFSDGLPTIEDVKRTLNCDLDYKDEVEKIVTISALTTS
jgi:hypothetical protein